MIGAAPPIVLIGIEPTGSALRLTLAWRYY
jgi:hypothetical protein